MRSVRAPLLLSLAVAFAGCAAGAPRAAKPHAAPSAPEPPPPAPSACVPAGAWVDPATRRTIAPAALWRRATSARIVLLGERHDSAEHHRWQLQTLAALHALHPDLVIGFESFARSRQPALDRWSRGELSPHAFLRESDFAGSWGFGADLYFPLFDFARMNRLPMRALNVDRALVARTSHEGWAAVPPEAREGIGDPAPAAPAYAARLGEIYAAHVARAGETGTTAADDPAEDAVRRARFVEAQLVWDRAFAEALDAASREQPGALVAGVIGSGHLEGGLGVPAQLAALGRHDVVTLLPWDAERDCAELVPGLADAVFGLAAPPEPHRGAGGR